MDEHKFKLEYVFINLLDNDFNFAMEDLAESLIRMFNRGDFTVEKCKDNLEEAFPKMMACLCHLEEYEADKHEELKRHEDYFRNQATCLFDFDEIKGYLNEHASHWSGNNNHLDREELRRVAPDDWMASLDLNLDDEAILIQFVSTKSGKPVKGKSSYRIF